MIDGLEEYGSMEVEEYADLLGNSVGEWCLIGMGGVPFIKFIERLIEEVEMRFSTGNVVCRSINIFLLISLIYIFMGLFCDLYFCKYPH